MASTRATDVTEFYRQLALLTRSDLPLPESIKQLAGAMRDPGFKEALDGLSRDTAAGKSLAAAMRVRPDLFQPFHVQLIATGEASGVLPDVLYEVAGFAQRNRELVRRTREALAYPLITLWAAFGVALLMLGIAVPPLEDIVIEFLDPEVPVGWLAHLLFALSHLVTAIPWFWGGVVLLLGGALVWLFSASWNAQRLFQVLLAWLPGSLRIVEYADYARLAAMLGLFVRHRIPLADACDLAAGTLEAAHLRERVGGWATALRRGATPAQAIGGDVGADGLLRLCFTHAAEPDLAADLRELGEIYAERALAVRHAVVARWTHGGIAAMAIGVGIVVLAGFHPLLLVMQTLGPQ